MIEYNTAAGHNEAQQRHRDRFSDDLQAERERQVAIIQDDMDNGSRALTPYSVVIRWAGGWDKTLAHTLGPRQARDLYAMLAKSWSPNGDVRDIPIRGGTDRFQVVVLRRLDTETDVTLGMSEIASNY